MKTHAPLWRGQNGMTLIELMVAMAIALLLTLVVFSTLSTQEGRKRDTTSVNDTNQAGSYAAYVMDGWIRSAGSGFTQSASYAFGCKLHAAKSGAQVLPRTVSLPAPFAGVNTGVGNEFRLAPILIAPDQTTPDVSGQTSDVLIVMAGAAGNGEIASLFTNFPAAAALTLRNTVSFSANDLVLVADTQAVGTGVSPCMVQQVMTPFVGGATTSLNLAGAYYAATTGGVNLTSYTKEGVVINLGNVAAVNPPNNLAAVNPPNFSVIGVGDKNTLYAYDLLQTSTTPLQAIADGVFELHALYGVDTDTDGKVDTWVKPSAAGTYSMAALMAGTPEAAALLQQIKSVRVGLIMRTSLPEKTDVATTPLVLFADLAAGLPYSRALTGDELKYRYRTVDFSVPLRNLMTLE